MSETRPLIVVGIDGSQGSEDALCWAAKQAQLTGVELRAVTAWQSPSSYGYYVDYSDADAAADAEKTLEQVISKSLGIPPSVPVTSSAVKGQPAEVLIDACRAGDLLVVGSRGRGVFAGMLLGSVSQHCVQHAVCPVVVVRSPAEDKRAGGR
jgi:nucleotide-binding universal stress UspA family protein